MRLSRRKLGGLGWAVLAAWVLAACVSAPAPRPGAWVAAWGSAQLALEPPAAGASAPVLPQAWREPLRDVSLRQLVRVSAAGSALRVRVSNVLGRTPLQLGAASVARALPVAAGAAASAPPQLLAGSLKPLLFEGRRVLALAPGAEAWSDPVELPVAAGEELAIQLHLVQGTAPATAHPGSRVHSWALAGDRVMAVDWPGAAPRIGWWHLAGVDVLAGAPPPPVLVAIGDSITDGYGVEPRSYQRWTDRLAERLGGRVAVVNTGIGGNRLLRDGAGPGLASRFERDALARSGATHVLMLIGVNDFGVMRRSQQDTPEARGAMLAAMQDTWRTLARDAHARGICLIAATVLPYGSSGYYKPAEPNEADRRALNEWLRSAPDFDGVADFDAVTRDPAMPSRLRAELDVGDGLHPSAAGYAAMAAAFPVHLLDKRCDQR